MKPHIEVAAAILWHRDRILISQRDSNSHLPGFWEFPGGKREAGESYEECLVREIREELNAEVEVGKLVETIVYEYFEKQVTLKFFSCSYLGGEVRALGCRQFQWILARELLSYQFPPANESIVRMLAAGTNSES
jgi:mutator protein MutT